ncbi:hypothetical protein JTB14_028485 [Gonioctena quinquepunctata]|nr:hypothetical protein JTB14_028485 [Gonioctena quinquepunctata]
MWLCVGALGTVTSQTAVILLCGSLKPSITLKLISPYWCSKCGKEYQVKRSLWRHTKFECDTVRAFPCHLSGCLYRATRKYLLTDHLKRCHHI